MITGVSKRTPTTPIRERFKLLSLHEIYVYAVQLFMFKVHHNKLPAIFSSFFVKNRDVHDYPTSYKSNLKKYLVENNVDNIFKELSKHF